MESSERNLLGTKRAVGAWRKAALVLHLEGGLMFQQVEKQEVDSWGWEKEVLTQGHGLTT